LWRFVMNTVIVVEITSGMFSTSKQGDPP